MRKKIFVGIIAVLLSTTTFTQASIAQQIKEKKSPIQNAQTKSVRCYNCPNNCLIKVNQKGLCEQYQNINGKLVPVNKNKK